MLQTIAERRMEGHCRGATQRQLTSFGAIATSISSRVLWAKLLHLNEIFSSFLYTLSLSGHIYIVTYTICLVS